MKLVLLLALTSFSIATSGGIATVNSSCSTAATGDTLLCPAEVVLENFSHLDVANVRMIRFRGKKLNWELLETHFPLLSSVKCLADQVECVGLPMLIDSDCNCGLMESVQSTEATPGVEIASAPSIMHAALLPVASTSSTQAIITNNQETNAATQQCGIISMMGLGPFIAELSSLPCLNGFLGGAGNTAGLFMTIIIMFLFMIFGLLQTFAIIGHRLHAVSNIA